MSNPLHMMKDASDLDPFSESQIQATRHFEADDKSRLRLVFYAFKKQTVNDIMLMQGLSISDWQRACYEANQELKSDPENKSKQLVATTLWSLVRYIQEAGKLAIQVGTDDDMVEFFKARGIELPKMPED